jgi:type VI secretion system protein ImpM
MTWRMAGPSVGLFGKLPSHGDFIERRVPAVFREVWDEWLQRCIAESQRNLGEEWLRIYLTSPMWRFAMTPGIAGESSYCGLLVPSVDRIGRYFPLTIVAELPSSAMPLVVANLADAWFRQIEELCAQALQVEQFDLEAFDTSLSESAAVLTVLDQVSGRSFGSGTATHWRWPIQSTAEVAKGLAEPLSNLLEPWLRPLSLWWSDGSRLVQPSVLMVQSLPHPVCFTALLNGNWSDGRWDGQTEGGTGPPVEPTVRRFTASGAVNSQSGPVRDHNEDRGFVNDTLQMWAVADGMGGYEHGDMASQMIVDALNSLEPTATLNAALASVQVAMQRVNDDLQRGALGVGGSSICGSTVVVLFIRGAQYGVAWAGDSRAYLFSDGALRQLTRDHSVQNDGSLASFVSGSSEITRAVGGEPELQLEYLSGALPGDGRFLLCSDGVHAVLTSDALAQALAGGVAEVAAQEVVGRALAANSRDNVTAVVVDVCADGQ